ncbi:MAG: hypothetical protein GY757_53740 [bacterium]|nr:hypothetical protein [bacterium]
MAEIKHIEIFDKTGFRKNIAEIVQEYDNDNVDAIVIMYRRKSGSIRNYWNGVPEVCLLLNEVFKRDVIENRWPSDDSDSIDFDELNPEGDQ